MKRLHGLDLPLWERYANWLGSVLTGNLGFSRTYNRPVMEILLPRLGNTVVLLGLSSIFAILMAIPLGVIAATRPRSRLDGAINLFCFAGISVPPFWLALVFIMVFAVTLGWLPAGGMGAPDASLFARLEFLVLPVVTLTIASLASYTRFARAAMIEVLREDYIRTARAKGVPERRVIMGHALRVAMVSIIPVLGIQAGFVLSGAVYIEIVFQWPGVGRMLVDAILTRDILLVQGGVVFVAACYVLFNIAVDVARPQQA